MALDPTINITTADNGVMVGKRATISGSVNFQGDTAGVVKVYVDPQPNGTTQGPFTVDGSSGSWTFQKDLSAGSYKLRAEVTANGKTISVSTGTLTIRSLLATLKFPTVTISVPTPDITPPVISLAASNSSFNAEGTLTLTATVSDNVGVTKVEFLRNGVVFSTKSDTGPWTATQSISGGMNGTNTYTAKAYDAANNSKLSGAVQVVVSISTPAPTVNTLTLDSTIMAAANTALSNASSGATKKGKRLAVAQAIVDSMAPSHHLNIYRNNVLIISADFNGGLQVINDGPDYDSTLADDSTVGDIQIGFGDVTTGSAVAAGDINTGTWTFALTGGTNGQTSITGTVGPVGSAANIMLDDSPFLNQVYDNVVTFIVDRSVDDLKA